MSKKDSLRSVPSVLHYVRGGLLLAAVGVTWAIFEPLTFATQVIPTLRAVGWMALAGSGGAYLWGRAFPPHPITQTFEDMATGWHITGLPGSGKTAWAYLKARQFCDNGWGFVWLSIKPSIRTGPDDQPRVLDYLPDCGRDTVKVFAPYSLHPLGLNFLRTYLKSATERELISDQCAELFSRMHSAMSPNMQELIRMGCKALLTWSDRNGIEVTMWELYRLFQEDGFRGTVLAGADKPVRDAFSEAEPEGRGKKPKPNQTLIAVRVQLRRMVSSDNLLVALSQTDGIDLWEDVMVKGGGLVCDTPTGMLGPTVAPFLCRCIASRLQMLTDRRPAKAKPIAIFCDEFQRYTDETFAMGIETAREYRVCWFLIHQTDGQELGKAVKTAVGMCANMFYFQQDPADGRDAARALFGRHEPEDFAQLEARHFLGRLRLHGKPVLIAGKTPDLPAPDPDIAGAILCRSSAGPDRDAILKAIQARKVGRRHADPNTAGADAADVTA